MSYTVEIAPIAFSQIRSCALFVELVDKESARSLVKDMLDSIDSLKEMPSRFPLVDDGYCLPPDYRKMVVNSRYIVLYKIDGNLVSIDYVLDNRSDVGKLFK